MRLRTTGGQATPSVVLGLMGKTADILSNYLLLLPPQYVVMTYFSSTLVYINGIQVINASMQVTNVLRSTVIDNDVMTML